MKNKNLAAIFAFFFGIFGAQKFYLGETGWGIIYLLFCWTYIPAIASFIEALLLLGMSEEDFNHKYNFRYFEAQRSRYLTNNPNPQVVVNIGDKQVVNATHNQPEGAQQAHINTLNPSNKLSPEDIDRKILKLSQGKEGVTLLDCFLELENIPKRIIKARLESLVTEEFLEITNRESDGKIIYSLNN